MVYPWSESFETAPSPTSYSVVRGTPSVVWNESEQALDVSNPRSHAVIRFNQPIKSDFWFEADIELISCPVIDPNDWWGSTVTTRHLGAYLLQGEGTAGYLVHHYHNPNYWNHNDEYWSLSVYPESLDGGSGIFRRDAKQYNMYQLPGWYPTERHILRFNVWAHPTRPTERIIQFLIDGALVWQTQDSTLFPTNTFRPGLFFYDGEFRIHSMKGGEGSGIGYVPNPEKVSNAHRPLNKLNAYHGHAPTAYNGTYLNFARGHAAMSSYWQAVTPQASVDNKLHIGAGNIYFRGKGSIVGTVKMNASPENTPLRRRVQLIEQASSEVVAEVWSTVNGDYRFDLLDTHRQWTVIAFDYKNKFRAVVADNLKAVVP